MARVLIDNGANINHIDPTQFTPLMWAAYGGKTEVAQLLILRGANVRIKDGKGRSALDLARAGDAFGSHMDTYNGILEAINKRNFGKSAQQIAQEEALQDREQEEVESGRRERSRRQGITDVGMVVTGVGVASGYKNLAAKGVQQMVTGEEQDLASGYKQDMAEQKRRDDEEAARREREAARLEAQHRAEEAARDKQNQANYKVAQQNNQQQKAAQQQQSNAESQQYQQNYNQRQQQAKAAEDEQYAVRYENCLSVAKGGVWPALSNHCNFAVEAHWCQDGQSRPCTTYDSSWTIPAGGQHPITEGSVHAQIHYAACREGAYIEKSGFNYRCYKR